jgi:hypothetical protein
MTDTACTAAIRNLASGRIADARLSTDCTVADATRAIEALASAWAMSRCLLILVTVRMISSWPSLVMQTLVAGS